ncbi:2'-5' RNA ligase family protein [Actinoplanes subglobosus]|uniref:2'-5' RNA ligase family protein n=1 Tax=Actinoplanes subglobosus TaxID=1547892 RepID=A0ABV8J095_9ACTN
MRRHLTILLTGPSATLLEGWRRAWDPVMAAVVPAHVTLLYPEEALIRCPADPAPVPEARHETQATEQFPTPAEVRFVEPRQVEALAAETTPFRLRPGAVFTLDEGHGGVFVAVEDVDGAWAQLRRRLLGAASGLTSATGGVTGLTSATGGVTGLTSEFPPHATVVHPRTSSRGPECWAAFRGMSLSGEFTVSEIVHTTTTAEVFTVEQRFPLLGSARGPTAP